jgi:hypothetical protein
MPFRSKTQRRKFAGLRVKGELAPASVTFLVARHGAIVALAFPVARILFPSRRVPMSSFRLPERARARRALVLACAMTAAACAVQRLESVRVTKDAIGGLQLGRALADLKALAQNARDTTIGASGTSMPGVAFHYPDLIVVGAQRGSTVDPSRPADRWILTGCGGRLPNDVPLCANWQELTRVFGNRGVGTTEFGDAVVRLCGLPDFEFQLDVGRGTVGALEAARDLSSVPSTARITRVSILRAAPLRCDRAP